MRRRYSREFKLQVCTDIRSGRMGWHESARAYGLSLSTIRTWLDWHCDKETEMRGKIRTREEAYEAKIAALERKVGQQTMEIELLKKMQYLQSATDSATPSIVSGPKVAPSDGGAK